MAIDEPNFSTFKLRIQEDEWVIFLKKLGLKSGVRRLWKNLFGSLGFPVKGVGSFDGLRTGLGVQACAVGTRLHPQIRVFTTDIPEEPQFNFVAVLVYNETEEKTFPDSV